MQIQTSAPFCASTYYRTLRGWGMDPAVGERDGCLGEYLSVYGPEERFALFDWADKGDADKASRRAYLRAAWDARGPDDMIVRIGM